MTTTTNKRASQTRKPGTTFGRGRRQFRASVSRATKGAGQRYDAAWGANHDITDRPDDLLHNIPLSDLGLS